LKQFKILGLPIQKWFSKLQMFKWCQFYNVNLKFYEFLIPATVSKRQAKKIMKVLENKKVRALKHTHLAALYLYIERKWGFGGKYHNFYKDLIIKLDGRYPDHIPLNSESFGYTLKPYLKYNWSQQVNHVPWDDDFDLDKPIQKYEVVQTEDVDFIDLIELSRSTHKTIKYDNGLNYLVKYLLYSFHIHNKS